MTLNSANRKARFTWPLALVVAAYFWAGCLSTGCFSTSAHAEAPSPADVLSQIHHINQKEIHLAAMALDKSRDPQVIQFAHQMIHDHTAADKKTEQVAKNSGIPLQAFTLSSQEKVQTDRMDRLNDAQFDAAYMNAMKTGHRQALDFLQSSRKQVSDSHVKSLISDLLPTVQHHERLATDIAANVNKKARHQYAGRAAKQAGSQAGQAGH